MSPSLLPLPLVALLLLLRTKPPLLLLPLLSSSLFALFHWASHWPLGTGQPKMENVIYTNCNKTPNPHPHNQVTMPSNPLNSTYM
jgi:hypothetical protein